MSRHKRQQRISRAFVPQSFDSRNTSPPTAPEVIARLDPLNFTTIKIEPFFNDVKLGDATGFFYHGFVGDKLNHWLVTNWHVITGRSVDSPSATLNENGAVPNKLKINLLLDLKQPEYLVKDAPPMLMQEILIDLYDKDGAALWYQHVRKNEFDVAVINCEALGERYHRVGINSVANSNDMVIQLGGDVFILGYPLGFTHFMNTPIWKRGTIASEPHLETTETRNRVVLDATTRQGMSGSPVIARATTHYIAEDGRVKQKVNATRFLGIYSSRPIFKVSRNILEDDRRAEVGYFYKGGCINETIVRGIIGPNFAEIP